MVGIKTKMPNNRRHGDVFFVAASPSLQSHVCCGRYAILRKSMKTFSKFTLTVIALFLLGCSKEDQINTKVEQTIFMQQHTSAFAAACNGKLSMHTEFTGDIQYPATTKIRCDDMNKEHDLFKPYTQEEVEQLRLQLNKINNVE